MRKSLRRRTKGRKVIAECGVHYVHCSICGNPTRLDRTEKCERCWALEMRLRQSPALAIKLLAEIERKELHSDGLPHPISSG